MYLIHHIIKGKLNISLCSKVNHKYDVVLFPTVPHLCMNYSVIQNNVHLKLNTYGYRITHILAI